MEELNLKVTKVPKAKSNELELLVEAPQEISFKAYSLALREASNNVDISGFRKGKAPKDMVEKSVGKEYISQKAFERIFYEILINVANQEKLDIVDVLQISSYELVPEKPLKFNVLVELKPEVVLGKYKGLKVKAKKIIYDKKIFTEKTLEKIANNLIEFRAIGGNTRGAKEGDQVTLDFEGKLEDGKEVPGGKAENFQAILEKDKFLPEFVNKLQGVNVGETKEIEITFPKSNDESVSGKKALFKVKINSIEEKIIPEINDELAKKVGMKDLVDLKEKIELQMKEIQEKNSQTEFENKLVEEVIKSSKFEISERMADKEIDYLLNDIRTQYQKNSLNWSDFKKDETNKELMSKAKEAAQKRISIDLVLSALIKKESITATSDEIDNEIKKQTSQLGDEYKNVDKNDRFRNAIELNILRNKAVDFLLSNNEPTWEEEVTKDIP